MENFGNLIGKRVSGRNVRYGSDIKGIVLGTYVRKLSWFFLLIGGSKTQLQIVVMTDPFGKVEFLDAETVVVSSVQKGDAR